MRFAAMLAFVLLTILSVVPVAFGQEPQPPETVLQPNLEQRLALLLESAERKQRTLDVLGKQRAGMASGAASVEVDKEIESTQQQLNDLREQFLHLATNDFSFSLSPAAPSANVEINWQQDIVQIIHPLLREMKNLTERPRLIERLNGEIAYYREQSADLERGLANLRQLEADAQDKHLAKALAALGAKIKERRDDIEQKLDTLERQLEEQRERPSQLSKSFSEGMRSFAINIGLYLLLATAVSLIVFLAVRLLGKLICDAILARYDERLIFVERGVHLVAQILGVVLTAMTFLMVLYAVDAWVLFALFLILTLGVLLSLRSMAPTYVMEVRTLLNLGSLRQNERLIMNGLPWRIVALDMYTLVHNPALGAFLRIPLTQISRQSSRPSLPDEPWFPTEIGDFVLLLDGMFGRIELQTPETVQVNFGDSIVNYRTEQFLNQRPQNLTRRGFTVATDFGIDYRHRGEATTAVVDTLRYELQGALTQSEFGKYRTAISVELKMANASSLDFRIMVTFKGEAAEMYFRIQRWLQRFAIDCANKHGWEIPFPQMTVHHSDDRKTKDPNPDNQRSDHRSTRDDNLPGRDGDMPPELIHI